MATTKKTVTFSAEALDTIYKLSNDLHITPSEVIRQSLGLFNYLAHEQLNGAQVIIRPRKWEKEKVLLKKWWV